MLCLPPRGTGYELKAQLGAGAQRGNANPCSLSPALHTVKTLPELSLELYDNLGAVLISRVTKHSNRLPTDVVESPYSEILKTWLDRTPSNLP